MHHPTSGPTLDRRGALRLLGGAAASAALAPFATSCGTPLRTRSFSDAEAEAALGPGGWCWFQAPRAAVTPEGRLWYGSSVGTDGSSPGAVEVTAVDPRTLSVIERHVLGTTRVDDHSSPSVLAVGTRPQVAWSTHARTDWIEIGEAGRPLQRIMRPASVVAPGRGVSYASAHLVDGERWMLYRGEHFSWNLLTSSTGGRSWTARGLLVRPPEGGHRPYVVAHSDGKRLHLLVTEGNPTEYRGSSVGHLWVDPDLSMRDGQGRWVGQVGSAPAPVGRATRLWSGRAGSAEDHDTDTWICDLTVADRRPTAILSVRDPWPQAALDAGAAVGRFRHRYLWARQRGDDRWTVEHLAWAGSELYAGQPDYTGLGVVDPTDPRRTVVSTDVHPATGAPLRSSADGQVHRELWEGYRHEEGRWRWRALTTASTEDNLRPVIAAGSGTKALLWMRGTYRHWTDFATAVVVRRT